MLAGALGQSSASFMGLVTLLWAPAGIAIGFAVRLGPRIWPGIAAGAFLLNLSAGATLYSALVFTITNTAEALLAAWLLRHSDFRPQMERLEDLRDFALLAAVVSPLLCATFGVFFLWAHGDLANLDTGATWLTWAVGDATGALLVGPLVVTRGLHPKPLLGEHPTEGLVVYALMLAVVFGLWTVKPPITIMLALAPFPLCVYLALRFGLRESQLAALLADIGVLVAANINPILGDSSATTPRAGAIWAYIASLGSLALLVSAVTAERTAARRREQLLEQQMLRSQRIDSLAVLAGGVAHDFNNLLQIILGNATLLHPHVREGGKERLQRIESASREAGRLANELLSYSGVTLISFNHVDVRRVVLRQEPAVRSALGRHAKLEVSAPAQPLLARGDAQQIHQLVDQLVANAKEMISPQSMGQITITLESRKMGASALAEAVVDDTEGPGEFVLITVEDNGPQLTDATRDRLLEPFFTTTEAGHGLGLAAVRGVVRSHRGALFIVSAAGKTNRITAAIPMVVQTEPPAERTAAPPPRTRPKRALIVDDDPAIRDIAIRLLLRQGWAAEAVADTHEALISLHGDPADVVILDASLQQPQGLADFQRLRAAHPALAILLSSGLNAPQHQPLPDERTASLPKPWRPSQLIDALHALCGGT